MRISNMARRIIVETPSQESDWLSKMLNDLDALEMGDEKHVRLYDGASLKTELERNGWTNVVLCESGDVLRLTADSTSLKEKYAA